MDELTLHPANALEVAALQDVASRGDEDGSVPGTNIGLDAGGIIAGSGSHAKMNAVTDVGSI